jgi:hypothetical protein
LLLRAGFLSLGLRLRPGLLATRLRLLRPLLLGLLPFLRLLPLLGLGPVFRPLLAHLLRRPLLPLLLLGTRLLLRPLGGLTHLRRGLLGTLLLASLRRRLLRTGLLRADLRLLRAGLLDLRLLTPGLLLRAGFLRSRLGALLHLRRTARPVVRDVRPVSALALGQRGALRGHRGVSHLRRTVWCVGLSALPIRPLRAPILGILRALV